MTNIKEIVSRDEDKKLNAQEKADMKKLAETTDAATKELIVNEIQKLDGFQNFLRAMKTLSNWPNPSEAINKAIPSEFIWVIQLFLKLSGATPALWVDWIFWNESLAAIKAYNLPADTKTGVEEDVEIDLWDGKPAAKPETSAPVAQPTAEWAAAWAAPAKDEEKKPWWVRRQLDGVEEFLGFGGESKDAPAEKKEVSTEKATQALQELANKIENWLIRASWVRRAIARLESFTPANSYTMILTASTLTKIWVTEAEIASLPVEKEAKRKKDNMVKISTTQLKTFLSEDKPSVKPVTVVDGVVQWATAEGWVDSTRAPKLETILNPEDMAYVRGLWFRIENGNLIIPSSGLNVKVDWKDKNQYLWKAIVFNADVKAVKYEKTEAWFKLTIENHKWPKQVAEFSKVVEAKPSPVVPVEPTPERVPAPVTVTVEPLVATGWPTVLVEQWKTSDTWHQSWLDKRFFDNLDWLNKATMGAKVKELNTLFAQNFMLAADMPEWVADELLNWGDSSFTDAQTAKQLLITIRDSMSKHFASKK